MRTKTAKIERAEQDVRQIVLLTYPGVTLLDVSGPSQVFGNAGGISADGELKKGPIRYEVTLASTNGGIVMTDVGVSVLTVAVDEIDVMNIDTLLVSGGIGVLDALEDKKLVQWYKNAAKSSRRFGSTCMGAFLLAETGLSDGQNLTTHWRWAAHLKKMYPSVNVTEEQIFIQKGRFWTSAGVTSGIDMALAMVEEDLGHKVSIELAKAILVYFKRAGNQMQYSNRLQAQTQDDAGFFEELSEWMEQNLRHDLSVDKLARKQGMSPRNFARVFSQKVGISPAKYVEGLRVEAAKDQLTQTNKKVGGIARDVGFGCEKSLCRVFLRTTNATPSQFRQHFEEHN